jgi:hypothetical protein
VRCSARGVVGQQTHLSSHDSISTTRESSIGVSRLWMLPVRPLRPEAKTERTSVGVVGAHSSASSASRIERKQRLSATVMRAQVILRCPVSVLRKGLGQIYVLGAHHG